MRKGSLPGTEWPRAAGEAVCRLLSRAALGQSPAVTGPCVCCGRLRPGTRWAKLTLFLAPQDPGTSDRPTDTAWAASEGAGTVTGWARGLGLGGVRRGWQGKGPEGAGDAQPAGGGRGGRA